MQRPRDALTARMARRVQQELEGADAALLMLNGEQGVGPGDRFIAQALAGARHAGDDRRQQGRPAVAGGDCSRCSQQAAELEVGEEVFPISARTGAGVPALSSTSARLMPEGPFLFDAGDDAPTSRSSVLLAELIREAVDQAHLPGGARTRSRWSSRRSNGRARASRGCGR